MGSSTVYFLPGYGGHVMGNIHCSHTHCANRTQREFLSAIGLAKDSGNSVSGGPEVESTEWPEPQPLIAEVPSLPYPITWLPSLLGAAVDEAHGFIKAPLPLVAASALGALSVTGQAYCDVTRDHTLRGPVSLYLCSLAESGERKTTCDTVFTAHLHKYDRDQAEEAKPAKAREAAERAAWKAKCEATAERIKQEIKKPTRGGLDDLEEQLRKLQMQEPTLALVPRLMMPANATPEGVMKSLVHKWPAQGILSAEGGTVFGSHGMNNESVMRSLAMFNNLWDGKGLSQARADDANSYNNIECRLTMSIAIQEATLISFIERTNGLPRGIGFWSRFLFSAPASTQGYREYAPPPAHTPAISRYKAKLEEILSHRPVFDDVGYLAPIQMCMSDEAKELWVHYQNATEAQLRDGGELCDVRDIAAKTMDNAVRLGCLFHVLQHGVGGLISRDDVERGVMLALWHLNESRRVFGHLAHPPELTTAAKWDAWLVDYCKKNQTNRVPMGKAQQFGVWGMRAKADITNAVATLKEMDRARLVKVDKRQFIAVNPALLVTANAKSAKTAKE
jgi:putative DNA primase/helicase